jgi:hypothetical protein
MNKLNIKSREMFFILSFVFLCGIILFSITNSTKYQLTGMASYNLPSPSKIEIDFLKEKYADVLNPSLVKLVLKKLNSKISDSSGNIYSYYDVKNVLDGKTNTYWISNRYSYLPRFIDFEIEESSLNSVNLNLGFVPSYFVYDLNVVCLEDNKVLNSRKVGASDSYKFLNLSLNNTKCSKVQLKFTPISTLRYYQYYFYVYVSKVSFDGFVEEENFSESDSLNEGLLLYYDFNDVSSSVKDVSGNGKDGKVLGSIDFSSGYANIPYYGSSYAKDYIDTGLIADGKNVQSISFWVNYADLKKSNYGVSGYRYGPYVGYWYYPKDGINFRWGYQNSNYLYGDTLKVLTENSIAPIKSGEWHLLTTTIEDAGNGFYKINGYIDGEKVNSEYSQYNGESAKLINNSPYTFFIGATNLYGRAYLPFYGGIDEFRIYERMLSDNEVKQLFEKGR